jgi:hypothetical protein
MELGQLGEWNKGNRAYRRHSSTCTDAHRWHGITERERTRRQEHGNITVEEDREYKETIRHGGGTEDVGKEGRSTELGTRSSWEKRKGDRNIGITLEKHKGRETGDDMYEHWNGNGSGGGGGGWGNRRREHGVGTGGERGMEDRITEMTLDTTGFRENGRREHGSGTGEGRLEDTSTGVARGKGDWKTRARELQRGKGDWKTRAWEWHGGRENGRNEHESGTGQGRMEDMSTGVARGKGEWKTRAREWHGGRESGRHEHGIGTAYHGGRENGRQETCRDMDHYYDFTTVFNHFNV